MKILIFDFSSIFFGHLSRILDILDRIGKEADFLFIIIIRENLLVDFRKNKQHILTLRVFQEYLEFNNSLRLVPTVLKNISFNLVKIPLYLIRLIKFKKFFRKCDLYISDGGICYFFIRALKLLNKKCKKIYISVHFNVLIDKNFKIFLKEQYKNDLISRIKMYIEYFFIKTLFILSYKSFDSIVVLNVRNNTFGKIKFIGITARKIENKGEDFVLVFANKKKIYGILGKLELLIELFNTIKERIIFVCPGLDEKIKEYLERKCSNLSIINNFVERNKIFELYSKCKYVIGVFSGVNLLCEAIMSKKPLFLIPYKDHIEQLYWAYLLEKLDIGKFSYFDENLTKNFNTFLDNLEKYKEKLKNIKVDVNGLEEIIKEIFNFIST